MARRHRAAEAVTATRARRELRVALRTEPIAPPVADEAFQATPIANIPERFQPAEVFTTHTVPRVIGPFPEEALDEVRRRYPNHVIRAILRNMTDRNEYIAEYDETLHAATIAGPIPPWTVVEAPNHVYHFGGFPVVTDPNMPIDEIRFEHRGYWGGFAGTTNTSPVEELNRQLKAVQSSIEMGLKKLDERFSSHG